MSVLCILLEAHSFGGPPIPREAAHGANRVFRCAVTSRTRGGLVQRAKVKMKKMRKDTVAFLDPNWTRR